MRTFSLFLWSLVFTAVCTGADQHSTTIGALESHDPRFHQLVSPDATIQIIARDFSWIEGPLWLPTEKCLVFSNIPPNKLWRWTEKDGAVHYLSNSGYFGEIPRPSFVGPFDQ